MPTSSVESEASNSTCSGAGPDVGVAVKLASSAPQLDEAAGRAARAGDPGGLPAAPSGADSTAATRPAAQAIATRASGRCGLAERAMSLAPGDRAPRGLHVTAD